MWDIIYLSQGKLHQVSQGRQQDLPAEAIEKYRQNLAEIQKKREWKTTGKGAAFMGVAGMLSAEDAAYSGIESFVGVDREKLIYAAALESSCGLYIKNPLAPEKPERFILRQNNLRIHQIDYDPVAKSVVASASDGPRERHIALCDEENANFRIITEGESVDITPAFSQKNPQVIYYASAGLYVDPAKNTTHYSSYGINRLNLSSGDLDEVLADSKYDFLRPKENREGELYCIRRPKGGGKTGIAPKEFLFAPFRLLKAIFSWLNFFSQRYTGESLIKKTGGDNPAKRKSEEELFIEGNLVNVERALKENSLQGEKYPGIIPKSWELISVGASGDIKVIKKGVLSYALVGNDLIYSNGKYLMYQKSGGPAEPICEARLATDFWLTEARS